MGNADYRKAYEAAASELEGLVQRQEVIEGRILALRKTMNALSTLCQQEGIDTSDIDSRYAQLSQIIESSITEDALKIVNAATEPLTTSEIREEMNKLGGSMAEHSNPLATINAVLNRLVEQGKVTETVKNGRKAWARKKKTIGERLMMEGPPSYSGFVAKEPIDPIGNDTRKKR